MHYSQCWNDAAPPDNCILNKRKKEKKHVWTADKLEWISFYYSLPLLNDAIELLLLWLPASHTMLCISCWKNNKCIFLWTYSHVCCVNFEWMKEWNKKIFNETVKWHDTDFFLFIVFPFFWRVFLVSETSRIFYSQQVCN